MSYRVCDSCDYVINNRIHDGEECPDCGSLEMKSPLDDSRDWDLLYKTRRYGEIAMQLAFKLECKNKDHIWSNWRECHVSTVARGREYFDRFDSEVVTLSECVICKGERILVEREYAKKESILGRLRKLVG